MLVGSNSGSEGDIVTLREERVSRNYCAADPDFYDFYVTLREERVSRNKMFAPTCPITFSHAPRGACE